MPTLVDRWRRRHWSPTPAQGEYAGLQPMTVVTGASEGIGRELALQFAGLGQSVLLIARGADRLATAAAAIEAAAGVKTIAVVADLATAEGPAAVDAALKAHAGYCDILVNNAAIGLGGPFVEHDEAVVDHLVSLNIAALTRLMHKYLPGMLVRGRGGILNVASIAGYMPGPHQAAYYASKAYVISLTEAVAYENRGMGVRIAVLAPGAVATKMHQEMGAQGSHYALLAGLTSPRYVARRALLGYKFGFTTIVPGLPYRVVSWAVRILPRPLLLPIVAWLLQRRN